MTKITDVDVITLGDAIAHRPEAAGNKAATLSRLLADGFPVPPGFVVTAPAAGTLESTAEDLSPGLASAIRRALDDLGPGPLAVRSSGVAEDLVNASFAGQYETVLAVEGFEQVIDAIRRCVASASSARVAGYAGGIGARSPMAVLVQRMIVAEAAGVAFTANPVTGDDEVLVSAVRGLGDRLVGGEATPDDWVVRGVEPTCLASPEGAITADQVLAIADLAQRLERTFQSPQDVEWAIAGGRLYLLQARPITALPRRPQLEVPTSGTWVKDTGHYPMPLTPFGASVYLPALDAGVKPMIDTFGLLLEGVEQRSLGGEAYMRVIPPGGKDRKAPPWWVMWLVARLMPLMRRKQAAAAAVVGTDLIERLIDRWYDEWRPHFVSEAKRLRAVDLTGLDEAELLAHLDQILRLLHHGEEVHFLLWPAYGFRLYDLVQVCEELLGWDASAVLDLVGGTSVASSEPGKALAALAELVARSRRARAEVEAGGANLADRLRAADPQVADIFDAYVDEHGHRTLSYDPGDPTLAERPEVMAALLRDQMAHPLDPKAAEARRAGAVERARTALADLPAQDRERFERALTAAARAYPVREDNVIWTDNAPSGLIRYTALEIGRRLRERGMLTNPEDVVFLEAAEARAALAGKNGDLQLLVSRRRAERAWVAAHPGPNSYGPEPPPPPDLRGLPPELRRITEGLMWTMDLVLTNPTRTDVAGVIGGVPGSPGRHTGTARVIRDESEFPRLGRGEILVCPITSPAWSVLFAQAGAVVTDGGGVLAHAAVIAREYGIPAVLATGDATFRIADGSTITVDGSAGIVEIHSPTSERGRW